MIEVAVVIISMRVRIDEAIDGESVSTRIEMARSRGNIPGRNCGDDAWREKRSQQIFWFKKSSRIDC